MNKSNYSFFLVAFILLGCGKSSNTENARSPRVKKNTKIESPAQKQEFVRGTSITFTFSANDQKIDSIQMVVDNATITYFDTSFDLTLPSSKVGTWSIRSKVFFGSSSETHFRKVIVLPEKEPLEMGYAIQNTYPHDKDDYTQGLLIKDGFLYESTGQRGSSTFKKKELHTGKTLAVVNLSSQYFGEGLALLNDEFYQLTWTAGKGFVYDNEMNEVRTFSFQGQGWGLTTYQGQLVFTDETEKLFFMDPTSFTIQSTLEVYDHKGKVESLNELEIIDGKIWANIYPTNEVVVIDPVTGEVIQRIDFTGLLTEKEYNEVDVLNGIAVNPANGKVYITGKYWPKLFEITINPKPI